MKHVQLSGAQKRKHAKENEQNNLSGVAKTRKVTDSFYKLQRQIINPYKNQRHQVNQKQAVMMQGQIFVMTLDVMKCHKLDPVLRQDL